MGNEQDWLENLYWISQTVLAAVALITVLFAAAQIRAFKLFEMLRYVESEQIRQSRRVVLRDIYPQKDEEWWANEILEAAASDVCASYDILGIIIESEPLGGYGLFERYWARSIVDTHTALEGFLAIVRKKYRDIWRLTRLEKRV